MLINKQELAMKLNVSVSTINNLIKKGLPKYKIGKTVRFNYDEVVAWFKTNKC